MFPSQFCLLDYVETLAVGACPCRRRVDQRVVLICDSDAAEGEPQAARSGAFHPSCCHQPARCKDLQNSECGFTDPCARCKVQVASCKVQVASCKLQVARCKVQSAKCKVQGARWHGETTTRRRHQSSSQESALPPHMTFRINVSKEKG
jgi:hypothetical protein